MVRKKEFPDRMKVQAFATNEGEEMFQRSSIAVIVLVGASTLSVSRVSAIPVVLETIIRSNDSVPGTSLGEVWVGTASTFSLGGIDDNGNVAFRGLMQGTNASPGPGGVN